ncbi:MAG TPA: nucleotidyltransferase domain-containing protein [Candidatus Limnocylindria bacterium]|nr:nucleotidyltransferase domain-containing protein [Candidatus Limnocylindria bacterium]
MEATLDLPVEVRRQLDAVVAALRGALGDDLRSVVLYGSAAEGRMRPTSDVNLMVLLRRFDPAKVDAVREPLQLAQATVQVAPMFVLEDELEPAAHAFAVKFGDLTRRHLVLYGPDPLSHLTVPRDAAIARLRQVLLNLAMRMRQMYVMRSEHEEQVALVIADVAGPLRASAATLLELEGRPAASPKEALERVVTGLGAERWDDTLANLSRAREERQLPPGVAAPTLLRLVDLASAMRERAEQLG